MREHPLASSARQRAHPSSLLSPPKRTARPIRKKRKKPAQQLADGSEQVFSPATSPKHCANNAAPGFDSVPFPTALPPLGEQPQLVQTTFFAGPHYVPTAPFFPAEAAYGPPSQQYTPYLKQRISVSSHNTADQQQLPNFPSSLPEP